MSSPAFKPYLQRLPVVVQIQDGQLRIQTSSVPSPHLLMDLKLHCKNSEAKVFIYSAMIACFLAI